MKKSDLKKEKRTLIILRFFLIIAILCLIIPNALQFNSISSITLYIISILFAMLGIMAILKYEKIKSHNNKN